MPSFPPPEPTVSYFDDLDFFKDFENEFPAIVYNDALMSKSDFLTEPTVSPQHIDEFNLKDETSLSECDEEEQNILNFNDLFPFNVIYPNDSKSDKDNDDDKVDIEHSSGDMSVISLPNVINTDDVYEEIIRRDSETVKSNREQSRSIALKARKESSDDDSSTSDSEDEEYAMAVRDFKKFFKRRGRFVRQPYEERKSFQRSKYDKNGKGERKCFKCGDPNHLVREFQKQSRYQNQKSFCWKDLD
ncbi:hypothetical protein Tco_0971619 [Tanacetum coccineum]